jgi:hypothetical protein
MSGQLNCPLDLSFYFSFTEWDWKDYVMSKATERLDEEFVRLALAINEHQPGYVDSYFGPDEWAQEAQQAGKVPLPNLTQRVDQLATQVTQIHDWDAQRKDFLTRQIRAMQMSLRLLAGEQVSLAEEAQALYDVQPAWKDEAYFVEYQKWLDETLPKGESLRERLETWQSSIEIPMEKLRELLPLITSRLRDLAHEKFHLPEAESFMVDFISAQPWMAYNRYLGGYQSRIEINTDIPMQVHGLAITIAHEGYPGHHTELCMKDAKLIRQMDYRENLVTLINSPWAVIAEGIATSALETVLTDQELEDWYREEILPRAEMTHIDVKTIMGISRAERKMRELWGNAAFMLHDRKKSAEEVISYLQKYELSTEAEANRAIRFMSGPLDRSYIFTYTAGYDLLEELFSMADREKYFARLLEEPVTPSQIRQWIANEGRAN